MKIRLSILWSLCVGVIQFPSITKAHRPATTKPSCGVDYGSSEDALTLLDPTMSWSFKHYADCTNRGTWISFENTGGADSSFYVGVLVPVIDRFRDVRPNALLIGPGLPSLNDEEWNIVPEEVQADPVWGNAEYGAILLQSPEDQTTCDHLGTVMSEASTVRNGRCDFYEPFGGSNSWPTLDADNNILPVAGATYYVAVWIRDNMSSKLSIALGTWVEDFRTPFEVDEPSCDRVLNDFHEKETDQSENSPYVQCTGDDPIGPVGNETSGEATDSVCVKGQVCESDTNCVVDGMSYETPTMVCGGMKCPAATALWEDVNMRMMKNMMDISYTGNPDIDFVRNMIPHHVGASDMCDILLNDLTCTEISDIDNLDGLVHLCNHISLEQTIEVGGMRKWLEENGFDEKAPCPDLVSRETEGSVMSLESCGMVSHPSASQFIELNHKMHSGMAIDISCNHQIDFIRGMLAHHEGAIGMCNVLVDTTSDSYLLELCDNITTTQYAEIAWMHEWMANRGHEMFAPCSECSGDDSHGGMSSGMGNMTESKAELPCEDLLSTTSFCHLLGQDAYCKCNDVLAEVGGCGSSTLIDGVGVMNVDEQCARTCGLCPARKPIFHYLCESDHAHGASHNHGDMDDHSTKSALENEEDEFDSSGTRWVVRRGFQTVVAMVLVSLNFL